MGRPKKESTISIDTDPTTIPFIFRNRDLTIPATKELKEYLQIVVEEDEQLLKFLHSRSQEYINYNGANQYTFKKWITKLKRDLIKTEF